MESLHWAMTCSTASRRYLRALCMISATIMMQALSRCHQHKVYVLASDEKSCACAILEGTSTTAVTQIRRQCNSGRAVIFPDAALPLSNLSTDTTHETSVLPSCRQRPLHLQAVSCLNDGRQHSINSNSDDEGNTVEAVETRLLSVLIAPALSAH